MNSLQNRKTMLKGRGITIYQFINVSFNVNFGGKIILKSKYSRGVDFIDYQLV